MKKILAITIGILALTQNSQAQNVNWSSIDEAQKNIVGISVGYDYGAIVQVDYYRSISTFRPILVGANFSLPMGGDLLDDFKVEYGGKINVYEINGFSVAAGVMSNFRQHKTDHVSMASFGANLSLTAGYFKPTWHVAAEGGFDKAISTRLKHTDQMHEIFPGIKDGLGAELVFACVPG